MMKTSGVLRKFLSIFDHPLVFFLWILFLAFGMIGVAFAADNASGNGLYDSHGRRDPFVPLVTLTSRVASGLVAVESLDEITVEGVVYDPQHGSAVVVNGTVLKEGEEFGNLKVKSIQADGAVFSLNGSDAFKPLYEGENKKSK